MKPDDDEVSSPYGPQRHTDEAAGGADSSPYENVPADERPAAAASGSTGAAADRGQGQGPAAADD